MCSVSFYCFICTISCFILVIPFIKRTIQIIQITPPAQVYTTQRTAQPTRQTKLMTTVDGDVIVTSNKFTIMGGLKSRTMRRTRRTRWRYTTVSCAKVSVSLNLYSALKVSPVVISDTFLSDINNPGWYSVRINTVCVCVCLQAYLIVQRHTSGICNKLLLTEVISPACHQLVYIFIKRLILTLAG